MSFEDKNQGGKEQVVDEFSSAIATWQERLAAAEEVSEFNELAHQAIAELDALCPFIQEDCLFSGTALYSTMDEEGKPVEKNGPLEDKGVSTGFDIPSNENGVRPTLRYAFTQQPLTYQSRPTWRTIQPRTAFLEIEGASIVPVSAISSVFNHANQVPQAETLEDFIIDVRSTAHRLSGLYQSVQFRKASLRRQQELVDVVTQACDYKYEAIHGRQVQLATAFCLKPLLSAGRLNQDVVPIHSAPLDGMFLGLSTIERARLATSPIRRERDIADHAAGLCMLLEVSKPHVAAKLEPKDIVMIPVDKQRLDITFTDTPA